MNTTKIAIVLAGLSLVPVAACSSSSSSPADAGTSSSSSSGGTASSSSSTSSTGGGTSSSSSSSGGGGDGGAFPPIPMLAAKFIDRVGRPAVNTALNHVFDTNTTTKGAAKDTYNQDGDENNWASYAGEFAKNLAIYDGLDGVCGNQVLAAKNLPDAGAGVDAGGPPARYGTLAGALANDRIFVNTATGTCTTYLAVELNATGVMTNTDCGGRKLTYNVVDATYNAVAGTAPGTVTNGTTMPGKAVSDTFPFLADPN